MYIYSGGMIVGFLSLHLSLWPLSDLLEHYPLVIWGIFACVVVVAVYREDVRAGGVVVIPLECQVHYCLVEPHFCGWVVIPFCDYSLTSPITVPLV